MAVCWNSPSNGHVGASVSLLLEAACNRLGVQGREQAPAPWPEWHTGCLIACPVLPPLSAPSLLPGVPLPAPWPAPLLCCSLHGKLHGHPCSSHTLLLCCKHRHSLQPTHTHLSTLARMCTLTHTHTGNSPLWTHIYGCSPPYTHIIQFTPPLSTHTNTHRNTHPLLSLSQLPTIHFTSPPQLTQPQRCPHTHGTSSLLPPSPLSLLPPLLSQMGAEPCSPHTHPFIHPVHSPIAHPPPITRPQHPRP